MSKKKLLITFGWLLSTALLGLTASLAGIYLYLSPSLPSIESLREIELQTPLRVYSIDNKLIGEFGEKRRSPVTTEETPNTLIDAILSAEDDGFYQHQGVDIKGLVRAALELITTGEIQSGGSTITMQVARNFFLTREQTFSRKFNEILLALKIERYLTKPEILELYLNKIYLGNRAYGVKAAAQVYYGKPLEELSLAQMAMIAGLPKAPSRYNPIANPSRALIRRDYVLKRMRDLGKIPEEDFQVAISEPVSARYHGQNLDLSAPYVAEAARELAVSLYGEDAYTKGYNVVTTVDSRLQQAAQQALVNGLLDYDVRHGYRGPEQQFDPELLTVATAAEPQEDEADSPSAAITLTEITDENKKVVTDIGAVDLFPWLEALKKIPNYGALEPAVVARIGEDFISTLTALGTIVDIPWENGLADARQYVDENFAADPPDNPSKAVKLGDVIRIYQQQDGEWHFSQVPEVQGAMVAVSPDDGAIRSVVGGFDFAQSSFNRATQAKRQPGSNFKPFIYTVGLESGMTAATLFNDAPIVVNDERLESVWRPENASGKFYGPTRLRKALYLSRNLVSIRLLRTIDIGPTVRAMARFGMDTKAIPRDLSMALGSYVMSPLEVATGYSVFANGGYKIDPYLIHHIRDRSNNVLYTAEPLVVPEAEPLAFNLDTTTNTTAEETTEETAEITEPPADTMTADPVTTAADSSTTTVAAVETDSSETLFSVTLTSKPAERVVDERIVYIMNSMLKDVIKRGTGTRAQSLGRNDLAGKTGTTNGPTDAWFSGFNRHLVATTWVGFDNNQNLGRGEYGGVAALPIWIDYMQEALKDVPEEIAPQPDGIVTVRIDATTGERAAANNPNAIFELFLEENAPAELANDQQVSGGSDSPPPEEIF